MNRSLTLVIGTLLILAATALAGTRPQLRSGNAGVHHGQPVATAKALGDTTYLLGNPANPAHYNSAGVGPQASGTFENADGQPSWNGWISEDLTYSGDQFWHVSAFRAINGAYSYWCGTEFDGNPGYGNNWSQATVFVHQVPDAGVASTVRWTATIQNDTEPAYDYTYLQVNRGGAWYVVNECVYDGDETFAVDETFTVQPADYVGDGGDEIQLRILFESDGAWSDADGLWDTEGAVQVDDITVEVGGMVIDSEDFEDQVSDRWLPEVFSGVGDYAALYLNLQDIDPCRSNFSSQVAFVDDGVVVPGTGGSPGQTWRYGPGGYIVNNTGGLAGPDFYINNTIWSPALVWPDGAEACYIQFEMFRHEELGSYSVWPGVFYQWHVRSIDTGDPQDLEQATRSNRSFVQYGGPDYIVQYEPVSDLLVPGRTHMQLSLSVVEYGYVWGWIGTDGTPAPYFDNVRCVAYPYDGPGMAGRAIDWYQDNFPASGDIDLVDLETNSVRLDAAQNVAQQADLINYPGDSCWFDISAVRAGSVLLEYPEFHVRMKANPLFDAYRVLPAGFTLTPGFFDGNESLVEGWVAADSCFNNNAEPPYHVQNRWTVDLPDEHFFYPGDVLKWYVRAQDQVGGDVGTSLLPGDTTGFASFGHDHDLIYPADFVVRALPTVSSDVGDQPDLLIWNDFIDRGADSQWRLALSNLGLRQGVDYDVYATSGPTSGVGNGLGGRATSAQLSGYRTLLYSSGDLSVNLLSNGDFDNDPSNDLAVVTSWFAQGDKNAAFTGDNIVSGLLAAGPDGAAFVNTFFGVNLVDNSILQLIENQTAPMVKAVPGNGIIARVDEWVAYGGCLGINSFDAVEPVGTTSRLAEFTDPNGHSGIYPYAAATYLHNSADNADVVLLPYDFSVIRNAHGWTPPQGYEGVPARAVILEDIITGFGHLWYHLPIGNETPVAPLAASNHPNPFNPSTTIELNVPRAGDVSLKVFNVRGELVRSLVDGAMEAGRHDIVWHGRNESGAPVSSGIYFYETRLGNEVVMGKMALIK